MSTQAKMRLYFSTWKIEHFNLTLLELEIVSYGVVICIRTGHRVFKWEWDRETRKAAHHD